MGYLITDVDGVKHAIDSRNFIIAQLLQNESSWTKLREPIKIMHYEDVRTSDPTSYYGGVFTRPEIGLSPIGENSKYVGLPITNFRKTSDKSLANLC